jgi:phosphoribosylformylglycinamidine synthase
MTQAVAAGVAYTAEEAARPAEVAARLRRHGIRLEADEVRLLLDLLGRPPRWAEAVLFGILWSEHCSYKSTRHLLRRLPTKAPQVLIGPGEDAGVVRLPQPCADLVLVLAHESHNHPSQVLPVEGAATGVGGIVRDVACMGAEVVGVLDGLRLGHPGSGVHARDVARGVVQGIADYGNALGVPNLGGETWFDAAYDDACLVNVMAVGLGPADGLLRSRVPEGPGPWRFVLVGKPTDESGFGGASFASERLGDTDDRGAVQLPDPFLKRVLSVANREVFSRVRARGIPAGFKDLGAGGVACATSELAAAGGCGAEIELDRAHRVARELPVEVLLCSETQERFCWVVPESFVEELCAVYEREFALGDVHPGAGARVIGRATAEARYRVTWNGEPLVDCPVEAITSSRRVERPARRRPPSTPVTLRSEPPDPGAVLPRLLADVELCSREYLYRHYDSEVQGRTWLRPGEADAVVIEARPGSGLGIVLAVGGHPHWCEADPELGARHAVAEAARNVACAGGRPWALTDCLNFGDPGDPAVMGDLEATIDGLSAAARALGGLAAPGEPLPFVSGNVSLYNQSERAAIPPSPLVLCAGVATRIDTVVPCGVRRAGDFLVVVGEPRDEIGGSAYLRRILGRPCGAPPSLDLAREALLHDLAVAAAEQAWVRAAHDVAGGGVLVAAAEMLLAAPAASRLGADLDFGVFETAPELALFSERPAIVFAVAPERAARLFQAARERSLLAWPLGRVVEGGVLRAAWRGSGGGPREWRWGVEDLRRASAATLERIWNEEWE